jgi:prephenate dehydrogenase
MKAAIIGGSGKMGAWCARFLKNAGKEVLLIGRSKERLAPVSAELGIEAVTDTASAAKADLVIISVPVDCFGEVVRNLSPHTHTGQIILDVTSLKTVPVVAMQQHIKKGQILGTHPVFGPGAKNAIGQNFVLTPTNKAENTLADRVKAFLEERGGIVSIMTPQEHDEIMAIVLGLAHYIAIISADTLLNFKNRKGMEAVSGITYRVLLTLVESVLSEDPELYASLQVNMPGLVNKQQLFQETAREWSNMVKNKDTKQFIGRMTNLKERLERENPDFGGSYQKMYRIDDELKKD